MSKHTQVPMSTAMLTSIKASSKGQIPPGLAKYLAAKKSATPVSPLAAQPKIGFSAPTVPMSPPLVSAIRQSPKGKMPAGLAKYLAAKKGKK